MNQIAKKGDMALVIGVRRTNSGRPLSEVNGLVVRVTSDPIWKPSKAAKAIYYNDCTEPNGDEHWIATHCLLPLRDPDADVTRTTDREVAA